MEKMAKAVEVEAMTAKKRANFFLLSLPVILMSFSYDLANIVLMDLIVYKTCFVSLNFNKTECLMLRSNSSSQVARNLETKVEPYASIVLMAYDSKKDLLPALLCLFLGPWSDRGGRRIPLLAAMAGITTTLVTLSLMADWEMSPWYLLAAALPANVVGSMWTIKLILNCYVSDTSVGKSRMLQMALIEASTSVGSVIAGLIGPMIYNNYGYANVFRTAASCTAMALLYTYFCVPETVENASKESVRGFFKISFVKDLVRSAVRKRNSFNRSVVWLAIVILGIDAIIQRGDTTIQFLFTRARLGWDVEQYSYFIATNAVLRLTGLCFLFLRRYFLAISDTLLAGVSNLSALSGALTVSLVWKSWHMYLASSIAVFGTISVPVTRSVIARFVPAEDVGKIFSLVSLIEILSSLTAPSLYTLIYANNLPPVYPSPVHLLSSCLLATSIICVIFIDLRIRRCKKDVTYVAAPQRDPELL